MGNAETITVVFYTRPGCTLCDVALQMVQELGATYPIKLQIVDIESQWELMRQFAWEIPVIEIGDRKFKAPIERETIIAALEDACFQSAS